MSRSFFRPGDPFWDAFWTSERSFFDTHFGGTLTEEDFMPPNYFVRRRPLNAPRSPLMGPHSPISATTAHPLEKAYTTQQAGGELMQQQPNTIAVNDKYQIMVDVSHFNPEEISVKMVDNAIVVTGKHEDKADNYGYVSRQFSRKYLLPADVEPESVSSTLSADGILTIQAPRKPLQIKDSDAGRSVPIAISNQSLSPALNLVPPQFPDLAGMTSNLAGQQMGNATISMQRTQTTTTTQSEGPIDFEATVATNSQSKQQTTSIPIQQEATVPGAPSNPTPAPAPASVPNPGPAPAPTPAPVPVPVSGTNPAPPTSSTEQ